VSLRTAKNRSANGSGDAYHVWNSAHASAAPKITFAVKPTGFAPPVSTSATSS
jgi:hypothetical protein